ncbi:hypothetical protein V8E53_004596 [Lactarius tabidus]
MSRAPTGPRSCLRVHERLSSLSQMGSLIRLDAETIGKVTADRWTETRSLFHHNTFLDSLTSFLHQHSADSSHIITATLRLWSPRSGRASLGTSAKSLPSSARTVPPSILLDPAPHKLITIYIPHVLTFTATILFFILQSLSRYGAHPLAGLCLYSVTSTLCRGQALTEALDMPMLEVLNEPENIGWRLLRYLYIQTRPGGQSRHVFRSPSAIHEPRASLKGGRVVPRRHLEVVPPQTRGVGGSTLAMARPHHWLRLARERAVDTPGLLVLVCTLDRIPVVDTHKVDIMYATLGQMHEREILGNNQGRTADQPVRAGGAAATIFARSHGRVLVSWLDWLSLSYSVCQSI